MNSPISDKQFPNPSPSYEKYSLLNHRAHKVQFALNLAQQRENFRWSFGYTSLLTVATLGVGVIRGKIPMGMTIFCSTCWCGTAYLYDLGYGSMIHRVNKQAHRILTKDMEFDEEQ
mmetsp:Transcript_1397/g.4798  ORF Transcript_1397/g.4798 Transcript_1397/m.4798 type:complete len:116 (-) Transcript_1397:1906-2253(-)